MYHKPIHSEPFYHLILDNNFPSKYWLQDFPCHHDSTKLHPFEPIHL